MRTEKEVVRQFYDTFGWQRDHQGRYQDTAVFVDNRSVTEQYGHEARMRVRRFLRSEGEYLLDAGSGAIPHNEYLVYSSGYRWRVCVDFSSVALQEARSKLGEKALCVQADITSLPFRDAVFHGVICAHVLYHVPADEQEQVVRELYRTLAPGSKCVILYARPSSFLRRIWVDRVRPVGKLLSTLLMRVRSTPASHAAHRPPLYSHAHDYHWFRTTFPSDWDVDVRVWSLADRHFTSKLLPNNSMGRWIARVMLFLEDRLPHLMLRVAKYPMTIISKPGRPV